MRLYGLLLQVFKSSVSSLTVTSYVNGGSGSTISMHRACTPYMAIQMYRKEQIN